jgi:hypothetical protein
MGMRVEDYRVVKFRCSKLICIEDGKMIMLRCMKCVMLLKGVWQPPSAKVKFFCEIF